MHYDQHALYEIFKDFMNAIDKDSGIEVTESDCLEAFKAAKEETGYGK